MCISQLCFHAVLLKFEFVFFGFGWNFFFSERSFKESPGRERRKVFFPNEMTQSTHFTFPTKLRCFPSLQTLMFIAIWTRVVYQVQRSTTHWAMVLCLHPLSPSTCGPRDKPEEGEGRDNYFSAAGGKWSHRGSEFPQVRDKGLSSYIPVL